MTWQCLVQIKPSNMPLKTRRKSQSHSFLLQTKFSQTWWPLWIWKIWGKYQEPFICFSVQKSWTRKFSKPKAIPVLGEEVVLGESCWFYDLKFLVILLTEAGFMVKHKPWVTAESCYDFKEQKGKTDLHLRNIL